MRTHTVRFEPVAYSLRPLPENRKLLTAKNRQETVENRQEFYSWRLTVRNTPTGAQCQERSISPDGWPTGMLSWRQFLTAGHIQESKRIPDGITMGKPTNKGKKNNIHMQICTRNYNFITPSKPIFLIVVSQKKILIVPYTCYIQINDIHQAIGIK